MVWCLLKARLYHGKCGTSTCCSGVKWMCSLPRFHVLTLRSHPAHLYFAFSRPRRERCQDLRAVQIARERPSGRFGPAETDAVPAGEHGGGRQIEGPATAFGACEQTRRGSLGGILPWRRW